MNSLQLFKWWWRDWWLIVALVGVVVALISALTWYENTGRPWLARCAKHRPLVECEADLADWKERY